MGALAILVAASRIDPADWNQLLCQGDIMRFFDMVLKFHADSVKRLVIIYVKMLYPAQNGRCSKELAYSGEELIWNQNTCAKVIGSQF